MKKTIFLLVVIAFSMIEKASAQEPGYLYADFTEDGICYNVLEGGNTVEVTFSKGLLPVLQTSGTCQYIWSDYEGDVVVPPSVTHEGKTYAVVQMGDQCFRNSPQLRSVTLPPTITSWGNEGVGLWFSDCPGFEEVFLSEGITYLPKFCFNSTGLKSVTLPSSIASIGEYCFAGCKSLRSVSLPPSIASLGRRTFSLCSALKSIQIPNSVTEIGDECFLGCDSLESVTLPASLAKIGRECFRNCFSLKSMDLPNTLTSIGASCFEDCWSLQSVSLSSSLEIMPWGLFQGSGITSVVIPSSVTEIQGFWLQKDAPSVWKRSPGHFRSPWRRSDDGCVVPASDGSSELLPSV